MGHRRHRPLHAAVPARSPPSDSTGREPAGCGTCPRRSTRPCASRPTTPTPPSSRVERSWASSVRQGLLDVEDWISLQNVRDLTVLNDAGDLSLGAMVTHRRMELQPEVRLGWPGPGAGVRGRREPAGAQRGNRRRGARGRRLRLGSAVDVRRRPGRGGAVECPRRAARTGGGLRPRPLRDRLGGGRVDHPGRRAASLRTGRLPQAAHPIPGGPPGRRGGSRPARRPGTRRGRRGLRPAAAFRRHLRRPGSRATRPAPARSVRRTPIRSATSTTTAAPRPTGATSSASRSAGP